MMYKVDKVEWTSRAKMIRFGQWVALFFFITDVIGAVVLAFLREWSSCAWVVVNALYVGFMFFYFKDLWYWRETHICQEDDSGGW